MKRKKINIKESYLLSETEQSKIRGGERHRWKMVDGSKVKVITPGKDAEESDNEE